jgi:hypothetical protein
VRSKKLNVSRREWRRLLVENWGTDKEPGGSPWFAEGRFVQHLTPGVRIHIGLCGRETGSTSSQPIRTLIGITCPGCTRVVKRIARRIEADKVAASAAAPADG